MTISVITVTADGAAQLPVTMRSVAMQTWRDVEHIVVDGCSRDATADIVARFPGTRFVERERLGLYDAINHGFHCATGDVIGMVHCGDALASPDVLEAVAKAFESDSSLDFVYGDLRYVTPGSRRRMRVYHAGRFEPSQILYGMTPPHPTLYIRREAALRAGDYALDYRIGADIEMWVRLFTDKSFKFKYLPMIMVEMATGGRSTSLKGRLYINNAEKLKALRAHGMPANPLRMAVKYWWALRDLVLDAPIFKKHE